MSDHTAQIGLVFGPPKTWFQTATCWVTDSPVYHCVLGLNNTECVGAESPVSLIRPISHFPNIVWSDFELDPWQRDGITDWGRAHIDVEYNFLDDFAIGIERLMGDHTPRPVLNRIVSTDHMECAQLVDAAYWYGSHIPLFRDRRYFSAVAPSDFVSFFVDGGWWPAGLPTTYRTLKARLQLRRYEHVPVT